MGSVQEGCGGLQEQIPHQGLDPQCMSHLLPSNLRGLDINLFILQRSWLRSRSSLTKCVHPTHPTLSLRLFFCFTDGGSSPNRSVRVEVESWKGVEKAINCSIVH